ncbi:unnamed protein product [Closterium sp. NIES-65]|nr:unnamed protein product [Closterium sp. NIES-65]CAI5940929.1 unnamed protein product [Closterium sp. NIES-65]
MDGRLIRMVRERAAEQAPASGQQGGIGEGGAEHKAPGAVGIDGGAVAPTIDTGMIGASYGQFKFGAHLRNAAAGGKARPYRTQLAQLRKGDDETAESYCNRARTIRAELLTIGQEVHMATFAAHVLKGLPPEYGFLRRKLDISSPDMTVERVCSEVLMEEQTLSIKHSYKQITSDASAFSGAVNTVVATMGVNNGKEGKGGKEQTDKKKDGKREKKRGSFKGRCYNCNEEGHMAAKCPNKKETGRAWRSPSRLLDKGAKLQTEEGVTRIIASGGQVAATARYRHRLHCLDLKPGPARNGATAAAACNWTAAAAACTDMAGGAASNGTGAAVACNGTAAATASNGTVKEIADVASGKPEANDGAASLKTYVVGSKATPNLWHARLGHVHFDAVKRTAMSGGVFGMDLEKGGEDMPSTSCHEAKLTRESFPLHNEREEQVLGLQGTYCTSSFRSTSVADSAPVGPEDGPLEDGGDTADLEADGRVAVDEQPPVAHAHEPSLTAPPIQPIPQPPRRSSRPNKGVPPVRFQPSALTAQDADDEENPYNMAYLAEDDCDTDSDDKGEYPDEDEEEEGAWGGVILDLAAALTGPEGKEWWAAMKEEMESLDEQGTCLVDQALYYKDGASGKRVWLLIYVDDLLAASEDKQLLQDLKELLAKAFQLREVEPVERYLGLQIVRNRPNKTLLLHQNAYVTKVQQRFFKGAPPKKQPITPLSSASFAKQDAGKFADQTMTEYQTVSAKALVMVHTIFELETF